LTTNPLLAPGDVVLPSCQRPAAGFRPPLDTPAYRSTLRRVPRQPLVLLEHRLTEVTGPLLGGETVFFDV